MSMINIGEVIKQRRKDLRISQEELCQGICDISTLSRLERGTLLPSPRVFQAMAERLGLNMAGFIIPVRDEDFRIKELCNDIIEHQAGFRAKDTVELIEQLEKTSAAGESPIKQFIMRAKAIVEKPNITNDEFLDRILQALYITCPGFDEDSFENRLFSIEELKCIMNIGHAYAASGDYDRAIKVYKKSLEVVEKTHTPSEDREKYIPNVSYSLSKYLIYQGRYFEALEVCDKAIWICINRRRAERLPNLYMNKGSAYCRMDRRDEGEKFFTLAYYMFIGIEDFKTANALIKGIKEDFDMELTIPKYHLHK